MSFHSEKAFTRYDWTKVNRERHQSHLSKSKQSKQSGGGGTQ